MFKKFYPNVWADSTYDIDYAAYYRQGYRVLLFDIDNTLVCHGAPQNEKSMPFLQGLLDMGFKIRFLSNNKEPRVKSFTEPLKGDAGYIFKAGKPGIRSYLQAVAECGEEKENAIFTGDQLFTDIWGSNRAGVFSILVKPIDRHEEIQIVLKRILEKPVLASYKRWLKGKDRYGLIGDPVGHSRSPEIHNTIAALRRDRLVYGLYHVKKEDLSKQIEAFKKDGVKGFNVTIPHKSAIIPFLDEISPEAEKIGAVNTVKLDKGKLKGINTDFTGIRRSFKEEGIEVKGREAVLLGAGGAARAVAAMLVTEGAVKVTVINRTFERAEEFCRDINERFETGVLVPAHVEDWPGLGNGLVCVQTTALGLHGEDALITDEAFYKKLYAGYDIVPMKSTDFMRRCGASGVKNCNGFSMLVNQAADAYEFFRGVEVDPSYVRKVKGLLENE